MRLQTHRFFVTCPSLARHCALALLVFLFLAPSPALAAVSRDFLSTFVGILIVPLLLTALVLLVFLLVTYRREQKRSKLRYLAEKRRVEVRSQVKRLVHATLAPQSIDSGPMLAVARQESEQPKQVVPPAIPDETLICPSCQRSFRSGLTRCPFDRNLLVRKSALKVRPRKDDYLDTRRSVMRCDGCGRQYDLGARYCPYDGRPLTLHEIENNRAAYDGNMFCPRCGREYDEESFFCPEDGSRLLPLDLDTAAEGYSALPVVICPQCLTEYPTSATICPKDGEDLLLVAGRQTGGAPLHGIGPKHKICPSCGDRYGVDAIYCCTDGAKLQSMN